MFDYLDYAICGMLAFIVMVMVAGYVLRLSNATDTLKQPDMFIERPKPIKQEAML